MAFDANFVLQASTTQTASTNSASVDTKTGTTRSGMDARVLVSAASGTTPSLTVALQHSDDNSTWYTFAQGVPLTAVGMVYIPFETDKRYVRVATTISGTTPSFTFSVDVAMSRY